MDQLPPLVVSALPRIEAHLEGVVSRSPAPENLREAMGYALLGGGKRIRPLLVWHACIAAGGEAEAALPACGAIELVHAFSLVHDDLPAMDDDDLRRGKPTLHIARGEAMAILAGDAMLTLAFAELAGAARGAELCRELAGATLGMIAGQVHDTIGGLPETLTARERVEAIHRDKTGALILAACRMGGLCATAAPPALDALEAYGRAIGLMFQIVDDLLDVEQTSEHAGKKTGKDERAGKITYPMVLGVDGARREVERLEHAAIGALDDLGEPANALREIARFLKVRTR